MLKVSLRFNGEYYKIVLRHSGDFNNTTTIMKSKNLEDIFPTFKAIRRNYYKTNKTIFIY